MRFKHIAITNWRGLYDAELALELDKGLNVVVGPNESGKSTLLEAIRLALTTKASSQKQSLRRIQPWNTDLKPHLELEFSVNDRDYRLTKTYLKSSDNASFAERLEDRNWTTVAEDDDAHSRFLHNLELREGEGFFRTLWAPQGKSLSLEVTEGLQARIEEAIGAATSELGDQILTRAVEKVGNRENDGWLTRKRRNPSSGSPWQEAADKLCELEEELEELKEEREKHRSRLKKLGELRETRECLREQIQEKQREIKRKSDLKKEWDNYRQLTEEAQKARERYKRVTRIKQKWDDQLDDIEDADQQIRSLKEEISELKEEKTKQEAREAQKYEEYQKARGKLEDLRAQRSYLQKLRGQTLQQEMEDLSEDLDQLAPPEREAFEKLQSIHQKLTSKREQLAASELKIDFAAERDLTGSLCVDGDCEEISPQQGETLDLHAVKSLRLELDGIGTLRVETAMEQALQTKDDLEEYQRELEKGLQRHEASSWEELKDRYQKGEKLRAELKNLKNLYETVETEGSEKAQAQEEPERQLDQEFIRRFRSASRKELQLSMEQKGESVDRTVENVNQLREDWENRKEEREKINRAIQEKESKLQGQLQRKDEQLKQLKKIKEEIQEMDGQLEQTTIRSPGPEDMLDREAEKSGALYRNLKALWRNARDKKEGLEDQLERQKPDGEEVTEKTLETLESQTERLNEEEAELEKEMHALQGEIGRTADGLHAEIRDREEQIEQQKRILESARKETRSYELLRLALQEAKNETSREFLGPIKDKVAPRIREMTANRYREVNFDSNLKPESTVSKRREVRGKDQDLSYGTREQIIFLTRLAMAEVVSQNGRIPVIFDDSLVNADQERMKHARRYLQEAARSCQIIVFTCHPNSYPKGEGPGKRIFLEPLP